MSVTHDEAWFQANLPHYRERVRVGKFTGWIAAGDSERVTIALDAGQYMFNVRLEDVEFLGSKQVPLYRDW